MEEINPLLILTGPTAVGKTALSIALAKRLHGTIISADSIQVYRHMDIGSAKITREEMQGIPHYLIDELNPDEEFNIYIFQQKAKQYVKEIVGCGQLPIIAGGTGFYIQSLLYDIDFTTEENDMSYRRELETLAREKGVHTLHEMLCQVDPESANAIHEHNVKRVIRALEYYKQTGQKISAHNEIQREKHSKYQFRYYVLNMERALLYERIHKRVDQMMEQGLLDEVKKLKEMGYGRSLVSMQGIGYKELYAHLEGELTLAEAVELIKKETRHFAKRQLTWFRREKNVHWINYEDFDMDQGAVLEYLIKDWREYAVREYIV